MSNDELAVAIRDKIRKIKATFIYVDRRKTSARDREIASYAQLAIVESRRSAATGQIEVLEWVLTDLLKVSII